MSVTNKTVFQEQLVDRVVREVLYQIEKKEDEEYISSGTAVLLTSYVPNYRSAIAAIEKVYEEEIKYIGFDGNTMPEGTYGKVENAGELGYDSVLDLISTKKNVVLLAPRLTLLEDIMSRRDEVFPAYIMIRSLLWGKNVSVLLDFETPKNRKSDIFERVREIVYGLDSVGIDVKSYEVMDIFEDGILELVTERDVRQAFTKGKTAIRKAPGAIVTPAAKDAAREMGIGIN